MPDKSVNERAKTIATKLGLKDFGRKSFLELCSLGCDPEFLAEYLPFMLKEVKITVKPKKAGRKAYDINLRPLDSYETALEKLSKRQLEALQEQLLKHAEQIEKINQTRLVRYLNNAEYENEIFKLPKLLIYYSKEFIPLLIERYEASGSRQRPQFIEYLNQVITHVEQITGSENYRLICDVLNELGIYDSDEGALKELIYRHRHKAQ